MKTDLFMGRRPVQLVKNADPQRMFIDGLTVMFIVSIEKRTMPVFPCLRDSHGRNVMSRRIVTSRDHSPAPCRIRLGVAGPGSEMRQDSSTASGPLEYLQSPTTPSLSANTIAITTTARQDRSEWALRTRSGPAAEREAWPLQWGCELQGQSTPRPGP
jgi:hypothetical protein